MAQTEAHRHPGPLPATPHNPEKTGGGGCSFSASRRTEPPPPTWRWTDADSAWSRGPAPSGAHDAGRGCELAGGARVWGASSGDPPAAHGSPVLKLGSARTTAVGPASCQQDARLTAGGPLSKCTQPPCPEGDSAGRPGPGHDEALEAAAVPAPLPDEHGPPTPRAGPRSCLDGRSHSGKARKQSQTRRTARGIRPARQDQEPAPGLAVPARAAV